jgi:hypothetical protein
VKITSPVSTYVCGRGNTVRLVATASTAVPGGSIATVEFYEGAMPLGCATLVGTVWTYAWSWKSEAAYGLHTLTAKAMDNRGLEGESMPLVVQVRVPADGTGDGAVDGLDLAVWQAGYQLQPATFGRGDYTGDGLVDGLDLSFWQAHYQEHGIYAADVPMPGSATLAGEPAPGVAEGGPTGPAPGLVAATLTGRTLIFEFDRAVTVGAGAVEVYGAVAGDRSGYAAVYDVATRTLTLTWAGPLPSDTYTVRLIADFVVGEGGVLDGDVIDGLPSGDGAAGGDALLEIQVQ